MKLYTYSAKLVMRRYFEINIFMKCIEKFKLQLTKSKIWDINFKEIIWKIYRTYKYLVKLFLRKLKKRISIYIV